MEDQNKLRKEFQEVGCIVGPKIIECFVNPKRDHRKVTSDRFVKHYFITVWMKKLQIPIFLKTYVSSKAVFVWFDIEKRTYQQPFCIEKLYKTMILHSSCMENCHSSHCQVFVHRICRANLFPFRARFLDGPTFSTHLTHKMSNLACHDWHHGTMCNPVALNSFTCVTTSIAKALHEELATVSVSHDLISPNFCYIKNVYLMVTVYRVFHLLWLIGANRWWWLLGESPLDWASWWAAPVLLQRTMTEAHQELLTRKYCGKSYFAGLHTWNFMCPDWQTYRQTNTFLFPA